MITDPSHPSGSALRERMIEDMSVRGSPRIRAVTTSAA